MAVPLHCRQPSKLTAEQDNPSLFLLGVVSVLTTVPAAELVVTLTPAAAKTMTRSHVSFPSS
jgi:hypothetical protein